MTEVIRRGEFSVEPVPLAMAREIVSVFHYAGGSSNTAVYRHGLFAPDDPLTCLGVALWLPPTGAAAQSVSADWRKVLSLTRLVVDPRMPRNTATFLLGRSMRLIRQDGRFHSLVTYADTGRGHTGAIYRASNWEYAGLMPGHPVWRDTTGRQVSTKATKNRTYAEMQALGYTRGDPTDKHKFVKYLTREAQADRAFPSPDDTTGEDE